jgi:hypothetical protein
MNTAREVSMSYLSPRERAVTVSLLIVPSAFLAILIVWRVVDVQLGTREVSRFIREHQGIVAQRLKDPKVHSFSLSHAPRNPSTLLIEFDVDDKATYLMLEDDLEKCWGLTFPASWKTRLRSDEDLGNNWGFAAQGIGEVVKAWMMLEVSAVASVILAIAYLCFALRRLKSYPIKGVKIEKMAGIDEL